MAAAMGYDIVLPYVWSPGVERAMRSELTAPPKDPYITLPRIFDSIIIQGAVSRLDELAASIR